MDGTYSARSAIAALGALALKRCMAVTADRRPAMTGIVADATGCAIAVHRGRLVVTHEGAVVPNHPPSEVIEAVSASIDRWLRSPGALDLEPRHDLPLGASAIITRLGGNPGRMTVLREALGHVSLITDDRHVSLSGGRTGVSAAYARGRRLRWEDGVVSIRAGMIPDVMRSAMAGAPLGRIVDDHVIADRIVRIVAQADPRERVLRIVTTDQGRREAPPPSTAQMSEAIARCLADIPAI